MSDDIPGTIDDLLRFGTVQSVDGGRAVVACGGIVSPPLPWLTLAGQFSAYVPLSVGEQVAILCPSGDITGAIVLGGLYSAANPPPASGLRLRFVMPDGATFDYDPAARLLTVSLPDGRAEVTGDVTITGNVTITGDLSVTGESVLGDGATQPAKLADDTSATKVKAK